MTRRIGESFKLKGSESVTGKAGAVRSESCCEGVAGSEFKSVSPALSGRPGQKPFRAAAASLTAPPARHWQYVNARHSARVARHILSWAGVTPSVADAAIASANAASGGHGPLGSREGWRAVLGSALAAQDGPAAAAVRIEELFRSQG